MTSVYVVILNWNGADDTIECLKSLSKLSVSKFKLQTLVVDNGSTDNSAQEIKEYIENSTNCSLITTRHNLGFAGGNNVGIRHAIHQRADYIFVLNNDTIVDSNVIVNLLDTARKYPKAGLISPKIYFAKGYEFHKDRYKKNDLGNVIWYAGGDIDWANVYGSNYGVDEIDTGQYNKVTETDFATGAAMLMNVKALKNVGIFDERYFLYLEDTDLSIRMKKKKWQVLYSPKGVVWHKVSKSSGIGSDLNDYFITRNRLLFGMRYASLRTKLALFRESMKMLFRGRRWQKIAVMDYYIGNFGKGSWK